MENQIVGKVIGLIEQRPVCKNSKGNLIAGDTQQFLDLLLCNAKGEEKLLRVPVDVEVVDFYEAGNPQAAAE
jgi:hypothetical protein